MLLNCGFQKTLESPLDSKEIKPVNPWRISVLNIHCKDWCWSWNSSPLATQCEELTHWKRPWCWEKLKEGGEGDDRGWDGWMASMIRWTWVWASSWRWWWIGKPGMLQSMGSQSHTQVSNCAELYCGPPGSSVLGDSPGKSTGVVFHFLLQASSPSEPVFLIPVTWRIVFLTILATWTSDRR